MESAYNDSEGFTAAFNRNLLLRLNEELGADFKLDGFRHHAVYNERASRIEMRLISMREQRVHLGEEEFDFKTGETIITEYSYKYTVDEFKKLALQAGLIHQKTWTDDKNYFSVQLFEAR
jgi:uncharacterized SAM-dependent methyltransferase